MRSKWFLQVPEGSGAFGVRLRRLRKLSPGILALLLFVPCLATDAANPETILVNNVRLIDRDGKTEDHLVNILIKRSRLDIVTRDSVEEKDGMLVLDARSGVLLGNLEIGQPASFMILDQDPRENFEVLLDTKAHLLFAVHKGTPVRNNLTTVAAAEAKTPPKKKQSWFSYTPPPVSLPVSYQRSKRWNRWDGKYVSAAFVGAIMLDRQGWVSQDKGSKQQVGDLKEFAGAEIRGFRVGAVGALKFERPWIYTVFAATRAFDKGFDAENDGSIILFDWRLDIPLTDKVSLAVGKQREPISMERITSLAYLPMLERTAAADALLPSRNVGLVLSGAGLDQRVTWAGGVFNDWFDTGQSFDESPSQLIGRATWLPYLNEDGSNLVHVALGVRYTDAKGGVLRYRTEPEFDQSPLFVDTGLLPSGNAVTYNPELSWRTGPLWLAGEGLINDVSSPELGNPLFHGYHVTGAWSLSGEMRPYNRRSGVFGPLPIAKSITQGGWGAWELATRWSSLDLSESKADGGEVGILSVGLNWWPVRAAAFSVNYRHILLDRSGTKGRSDGVLLRLLLMLD